MKIIIKYLLLAAPPKLFKIVVTKKIQVEFIFFFSARLSETSWKGEGEGGVSYLVIIFVSVHSPVDIVLT